MEHCFLHPLPLVQADLLISSEIGWDILKPGQKSPPATAYKETITKNNCTYVQLGQLWTIRYKKATNQLLSLRCSEQKQGTTEGVSRPPKTALWPATAPPLPSPLPSLASNQGNLFLVSAPSQHKSQQSLACISLLASCQLLLIKESKDSSQ